MEVRLSLYQRFTIYSLNLICFLIIMPLNAEAKQPKLGQLNTTDKMIMLPVTLTEAGKSSLGELTIQISPKDEISLLKSALVTILKSHLKPEVLTTLKALDAPKGFILLNSLQKKGFDLQFSSSKMELSFFPKVNQRPEGDSSFAAKQKIVSEDLSYPASFSAYVNLLAAINNVIIDNKSELQSPTLGLEFAASLYGVVLETEATFNSAGSNGIDFKQYLFSRLGSRLIYDLPEYALRFQFGDLRSISSSVKNLPDALGFSVEKSQQKLRPRENIRSTGRSSFQLDRPSTVEVRNNGNVVRTLRLKSGRHNISDLQLRQGANDITLYITDDLGNIKDLEFSIFSHNDLLGIGINEWGFEAGFRSNFEDNELLYEFNKPVVSGFYRQGVSQSVTGEGYFQWDKNTALGGMGFWTQSRYGFFNVSAELSRHKVAGFGSTANISWSRQGETTANGWRSSFRLSADYTSNYFTTISTESTPSINSNWIRLNGNYSQSFSGGLSASLSANYVFMNAKSTQNKGDTYGVDLSVRKTVTPDLGLGVTVGYSNNSTSSSSNDFSNQGEWYTLFNVNYRLGTNARLSSGYSTRTEEAKLSYSQSSEKSGVGSWQTNVDVDYANRDKRTSLTGNLAYVANRSDINFSHGSTMVNAETDSESSLALSHNTRLQIGTSLAFAGGKLAWGRPIRSGGFAVVSLHDSLEDSTLTIGTADNVIAESSIFGAVVVSGLNEYSLSKISVDVEGAPIGYDLGSGTFDMLSAYKSGYDLRVGSNYSVSAYGILMNEHDEPLEYLSGTAYEGKDKKGRKTLVFTNKVGRFGAEGLAPGVWVIEMGASPVIRYTINIPDETKGMFKTGTLKPDQE
jgi:outer membrane usher protein